MGNENFLRQKNFKKFIKKFNITIFGINDYHLRTVFYVNVETMNNERYVFSSSNHRYEKVVLLYCLYDD